MLTPVLQGWCYKTASPRKPPARELCLTPHIKVPYANFSCLHRVAHIRAQDDLISNDNPLTGMHAGNLLWNKKISLVPRSVLCEFRIGDWS